MSTVRENIIELIFDAEVDGYEPDCVVVDIICTMCNHSLKDNDHGLDQNDIWMDEKEEVHHTGSCTYCKECNPRLR